MVDCDQHMANGFIFMPVVGYGRYYYFVLFLFFLAGLRVDWGVERLAKGGGCKRAKDTTIRVQEPLPRAPGSRGWLWWFSSSRLCSEHLTCGEIKKKAASPWVCKLDRLCQNQSGQVPISSYLVPFCGLMPPICKHNMTLVIAKRKMKKKKTMRMAIGACQVMEVSWGYKPHPMKTLSPLHGMWGRVRVLSSSYQVWVPWSPPLIYQRSLWCESYLD